MTSLDSPPQEPDSPDGDASDPAESQPVEAVGEDGARHRVRAKRKSQAIKKTVHAVWLPAVILAVVIVVGYGVSIVRQNSSLISSPPSDHSIPATVVPINPKNITYEVFGDLGAGGKVVYANVNSEPVEVQLDTLPWTYTETTMLPSASLSLVTQVAGGSVGCRILVDGQVRDEQAVTHAAAAAACTVTAA